MFIEVTEKRTSTNNNGLTKNTHPRHSDAKGPTEARRNRTEITTPHRPRQLLAAAG